MLLSPLKSRPAAATSTCLLSVKAVKGRCVLFSVCLRSFSLSITAEVCRPLRALISTHFIHTDIYLKKFIYARMYINDRSLFRRHQKTSHSACARFKCPLCAKRFKDECRLKQHHLDHADQTKKFICSYCSKAWNRPSDLGIENAVRFCIFIFI